MVGANLSGGEILSFRVYRAGAVLDGYTNTPSITAPTPPQGEIQQSHFRIRNIGALQTINQDSDWAAAIDVNATLNAQRKDAGVLFGLRIQLEEIATTPASKTIIPKIQGRVNAGTWADLGDEATDDYIDPGSSTETLNVIVVNKATITDGAATTKILSGSSKTFVAGTGEHQAIGASVTLNDQCTEIEWRILIRNRYETRQESDDADEYEFRVVESDGTLLDGTYVIPKITINLDGGYMGGVGIETQSRVNFIATPDGTLYSPLEDSVTGQNIIMTKSTDGGITWSQLDAATSPENDMESWSMDYDDTNKVIHCVHVSANVTYFQFATEDHATVPDTWIDARTVVLETGITVVDQSSDIVIRGSTLYAFYPDGGDVYYKKKADLTTGTFGSRVSIDVTGGRDLNGIVAVLGPNSDLIHMFYPDYTAFDLFHRSLNTSDVLGTIHTIDSDIDNGNQARHGMTNPISWYNGTNEKAMIGFLDETNQYLYTVVVQDDGSPDTRQVASNSVVVFSDPFPGTLSRQPIATLAVDDSTDIAYVLYSDDATHDLWRATHADEGSWANHTEVMDSTDIHAIRAQVYTKGDTSVVLGYVLEEAYNQDGTTPISGYTGNIGYLEYEITAASTTDDLTANSITASPTLDTPTLGQEHDLTATGITTNPVVDQPTAAHIHDLTATGITTNPVVDQPTAAHIHDLDATEITTNPVVDQPTAAHIHDLDATEITTNPVVDNPTLTEEGEDALTANGITTNPVMDQPTAEHIHDLSATGITTNPVVGQPTATHIHDLTATAITANPVVDNPTLAEEGEDALTANGISTTPVLDNTSIGQEHALSATEITADPVVDNPTLTEEGEDALTANSITANPILDTPALAQEHALAGVGITTNPVVGQPTATHIHDLAATSITADPVVDNPTLAHIHNLTPTGITADPVVGNPILAEEGEDALDANGVQTDPVVDNPTLGQTHALDATAVTAGPVLDTPALTTSGEDNLTATGITTSPVVETPAIGQVHVFTATGIVTTPEVETAAIGQIQTLDAAGIETTPVVDTPAVSHIHVLSAIGITASPVVDVPSIAQIHELDAATILASPLVGIPSMGQTHILGVNGIITTPVLGTPMWDLVEGVVVITFTTIYPEAEFTVIKPEITFSIPMED
jgi:hypothetical protein